MGSRETANYPFVFVHGMFGWGSNEGINSRIPYWGATTGDLIAKMNKKGFESYAASVGPISGAWDQACELYAQLTATRVDYGAAHAKKHGHNRFGRAYYKPLLEGWSSERKIHLIGHSFGGNASRMLAHLLANGAPEEVKETGDETSPLFTGGHGDLVCSVTAICSPLNGTAAYEVVKKYHLIKPMRMAVYTYCRLLSKTVLNGKLFDFHLERINFTKAAYKYKHESFRNDLKKCERTIDDIAYDMTDPGAKSLNMNIDIAPDTYYFSYPFNAVRKDPKTGKLKPKDTDFLFLALTSSSMLKNARLSHADASLDYVENDGLVNVAYAKHPPNEPFKEYKVSEEPVPGIWHVMPTSIGDHGTAIGLFADEAKTVSFYLEMLGKLRALETAKRPQFALR